MSDVVHLILKYKWFDLIEKGEKTVEYRNKTDYWRKRLKGKTKAVFHRGYTSRTSTFHITRIKESFRMFIIYLGERLT